jgi:ubiquinone/menaquinone biosynthesis C-methylase UbiE
MIMASQPSDFSAYKAFEHKGWERATPKYHDAFGFLTIQATQPLLEAVDVRSGMHVLDVATGPGYVAAAAAQRGANVVGIDFSAAMVAEARQCYPALAFQEADAEDLPFSDKSFDSVVMNFGLMHLEKPEQALAEAYRVLRAGGKLGFTVWAKPDEAVGFGMVLRAVQDHGSMNVPLPPGPPLFRFSEPAESCRALLEAGFLAPQVVMVQQVWRLPSPDALFENMQGSTVRTAGLLRAQTPGALQAIRAALCDMVRSYQIGDMIELPMPAVLASAIRR